MLQRLRKTLTTFYRDEKGRLIAYAAACSLLLLVALLLPLAFRAAPSGESHSGTDFTHDADAKGRLFAEYWYSSAETEGRRISVRKDEPDAAAAGFCEEKMALLTQRWIQDQELSALTPTGREYTLVEGSGGTELHLCRMWVQAQGDWQNWMDVCFDTETGSVYYLYVSRECLTNQSRYAGQPRSEADAIAALLAEEAGGHVRHFSGNGSGGTAVVSLEHGTLCYEINTVYYDALIDVRINCI